MPYHLPRPRLLGLMERLPHRHRYCVTETGWRVALFFTHTYARLLRPGLTQLWPKSAPQDSRLGRRFTQLEAATDQLVA